MQGRCEVRRLVESGGETNAVLEKLKSVLTTSSSVICICLRWCFHILLRRVMETLAFRRET
jgi:hypothetical protein